MQPKKGATMGTCQVVSGGSQPKLKNNRRRTHPEVVAASRPDLVTIAKHIADQARAKVTSKIDSIARFPAEASTNTEDDEEQAKRREIASSDIAIVLEGVDQEHQESASDELGEELTGLGHERRWVGAEDSSTRGRLAHGADAGAALEDVNGRLVIAVNNRRCTHGTEDLSDHVNGEFPPGKLSEDAVGKGDCRVEMGAGNATGVNT